MARSYDSLPYGNCPKSIQFRQSRWQSGSQRLRELETRYLLRGHERASADEQKAMAKQLADKLGFSFDHARQV